LLGATQAIERSLGRPDAGERVRNAPRPVDLDILVFGDETIADEDLVIPHPRMAERRFVLRPLADILPELVLPSGLGTVAECLKRLEERGKPESLLGRVGGMG
jgi:2-amino-4-hydroxy-6-hydroxymethyldihydropteridine diphosphokinase